MSRRTNNFTPTSWSRRAGRDYDIYAPSNDRDYVTPPIFPQLLPAQSTPVANRGGQDALWVMPERFLRGPLNLAGVPAQPYSPMQILVLNTGMSREPSPPGFMGQMNFQSPASTQAEEPSRLTQEEQKKALKKLRKEIYNPVPKNMTRRLSLYYRDRALDALKERAREKDEDGKRCAVCLEDFEPQEWVMLTPCDHMFHEECIVPWVKSHGQCPVCRFALGEQSRRSSSATAVPNITNAVVDEDEIISVLRAMEEVFIPVHW